MAEKKTLSYKQEYGVTGLKIANGYVYDEFLPELEGIRGRRKYREMKDNDPTIGALLTAVQMLIRAVDFRFEPATDDIDNTYVDFTEKQFQAMEYPWTEMLSEVLSMLPFGFAVMEIVASRDSEGNIVISNLTPRAQETIWEWDADQQGNLKGLWQWPPFGGQRIYIPRPKFLLFRTELNRSNPEGRSIIRNAYRSWYFIKQLTMLESIAHERNLAGMPLLKVPAEAMQDASALTKFTKVARDLRFNEQAGLVLPSDPHQNEDGSLTSVPKYELKLVSAEGSRTLDISEAIKRHQHDMVRSVLADFLMLGSNSSGSFALSRDKTDLFLRSIEGYLNIVCSVMNRHYMAVLWKLNGFDEQLKPRFTHGNVAPEDLQALGNYIRDTGLMATADPELENTLRERAGLPVEESQNVE